MMKYFIVQKFPEVQNKMHVNLLMINEDVGIDVELKHVISRVQIVLGRTLWR